MAQHNSLTRSSYNADKSNKAYTM